MSLQELLQRRNIRIERKLKEAEAQKKGEEKRKRDAEFEEIRARILGGRPIT
jgi:hypothetical protein